MATVANDKIKFGFIGDSHSCGFYNDENNNAYAWSTNNYAEIFLKENNYPGVVYAMAGASNRLYVNWVRVLLDRYPNIENIFIQLTYPSRWMIGFDQFRKDCVPVDTFTVDYQSNNENIHRLTDTAFCKDTLQMLFKPAPEFWDDFEGFRYNDDEGLTQPSITKTPYYQVKMFFELNTHIEKQDQLMWIKLIDSMCADRNVKVHYFKMKPKIWYDYKPTYWGDIKGNFADCDVETFFATKHIFPKNYVLDNEHYNEHYHNLIAKKYIPYLLGESNGK